MIRIQPRQLSKKQIDILLSVWIVGHNALTKKCQCFKADNNSVICTLSDKSVIYSHDADFVNLIELGYIEKINDFTYILSEDIICGEIVTQFTNAAR